MDPTFLYFNFQKQYLRKITFVNDTSIAEITFDVPNQLNKGNTIDTDATTLLCQLNKQVEEVRLVGSCR